MKAGIELLFALQKKDDFIKEIEEEILKIPKLIELLEKEKESKKSIIAREHDFLKKNLEERKAFDIEIQKVKDKIAKYQEQLKKITTNEEYKSLKSEIKNEEDAISQIEEKIIEKMLEADQITEKIKAAEQEFQKIAQDFDKKISDLNKKLVYQKEKLISEKLEREKLASAIESQLIKIYNNLFQRKAGKVVSEVKSEFCGICNIKIRPQILSELITSEDLVVCENCGRILFKEIPKETEENAS